MLPVNNAALSKLNTAPELPAAPRTADLAFVAVATTLVLLTHINFVAYIAITGGSSLTVLVAHRHLLKVRVVVVVFTPRVTSVLRRTSYSYRPGPGFDGGGGAGFLACGGGAGILLSLMLMVNLSVVFIFRGSLGRSKRTFFLFNGIAQMSLP